MISATSFHMIIIPDISRPQTVTEVVKLPVAPEKQQALLDYIQRWHETVFPTLPGFQQAAILRNSADAILVYGHWDSQEAIEQASHDRRLRLYFQGLMPLLTGRPEVHICSVEAVVAAKKPLRRLEIQPY